MATGKRRLWVLGLLSLVGAGVALAAWLGRPRPAAVVAEREEAPPKGPGPQPPPKDPPAAAEPWEVEAAEARRWMAGFREELKTAADPAAVAARVAKDPDERRAVWGVVALAEYWEDPRTEPVLADLGRGEPKTVVGRCVAVPTLSGSADVAAQEVRARKAYRDLMRGADTPAERLARARRYLADPPDWEAEKNRLNHEPLLLISWLLDAAVESGAAEAMDLLHRFAALPGDASPPDFRAAPDPVAALDAAGKPPDDRVWKARRDNRQAFLARHGDWLVRKAKELGRAATLRDNWLNYNLWWFAPRAEVVPLLEAWFKESADEKELELLMDKLQAGPNKREVLTAWTDDPRPFVAGKAAFWLSRAYEDDETVRVLRRLADRRRREGADPEELTGHARGILFAEQAVAGKRLAAATDDGEIGRLVAKLFEEPEGGGGSVSNLVDLLYDPRPAVAREAAYRWGRARETSWNREYERRVRRLAEERGKAGAPPEELARYADALRVIEARLAEGGKEGAAKP